MLLIGKVSRALAAGCAVAVLVGCSSPDEPDRDPGPDTTVVAPSAVTAALLVPADVGPTWKVSEDPLHPTPLMPLCGGGEDAPPLPGGPQVAASQLADQGKKGLQTLDQVGLVYSEPADAVGGLAALKAGADGCATSLTVPAEYTDGHNEAAYTETLAVSPLTLGQWTGFVVERHKLYEPNHPGAADTAVAVISLHNVLLVDSYAIYELGAKAAAPQFSADWHKLVSATVDRVAAT